MTQLRQAFLQFSSLPTGALLPLIVAISAFLVFAPTTGFGLHLSWHDEQRIGQIALLFVVMAALVEKQEFDRFCSVLGFLGKPVIVGLALLLAGGMVSSLLAPLPRWAFLESGMFILLVMLALSVASMPNWCNKWLLGVLTAAAAAYSCGFAVAYSAILGADVPLLARELFNGFSNIRFFGHFQVMTLPFLVLPAMLWPMPRRYRIALGVLNVFWWMLAIASGTRGSWLAMGIAFCAAAFCRETGRRWLRAEMVFLAGGALSYLVFFDLLPWLLDIQSKTEFAGRFASTASLSTRKVLWQQALNLIAAHPWVGVGPMHFAYYPAGDATHPHNALLQWAAEWGVPSAILLSVGVALGLRALFVRIRQDENQPSDGKTLLRIGVLCSIVAAITLSMLDGVIVMPYSQTLLAVIAGWALGLHLEGRDIIASSLPRLGRITVAIVSAFAIGCIVAGVFPDVLHLQERENVFALKHGDYLQPRFWRQGAIYD